MQDNFAAFMADFGVLATWAPGNGGASSSALVFLDVVENPRDYGEFRAVEKEIEITYQAANFSGLKRDEVLTINGAAYRVREIAQVDDGLLKRALLGEF